MGKEFTPQNIIGFVQRSLPNSEQVVWLELERPRMLLEWRGIVLQITVETLYVEEIRGNMLHGSNEAALVRALLMKQWLIESENERK